MTIQLPDIRLFVIVSSLLLVSCSNKKDKKKIAFYDSSDIESGMTTTTNSLDLQTSYIGSSNVISIPFEEHSGIKQIDVTVNGQFTVKMIFDSGCSGTLISVAEAKYLYEKGCFDATDILGTTHSQIADGSIVENQVINLKELVIGNRISCTNVIATVSSNAEAPLLLGNEVLDRVPQYTVDNENKVIKFHLKSE